MMIDLDAMQLVTVLAVGFCSAVFGSIVGLGGGIIIVPALLLLGLADHSSAVGISLTVLIVTAASSAQSYWKRGFVDVRSGLLLAATSAPAAACGAWLTNGLATSQFSIFFGLFMLAMAALLIARDWMKPVAKEWSVNREFVDGSGQLHRYSYSVYGMLLIGIAVGTVSGLFGVGGGSLFVPLMVILFRFPPHVATATSMFTILFAALSGSATQFGLGHVDLTHHGVLLLLLAPGAWFGGKVGAWLAGKLTGKTLLWVLRVTLILFAVRFLLEGV